MNGTFLALGALFAAAGAFVYTGRALKHLAAWNAMSPQEQRRIRAGALCRNAGTVIAASGLLFLIGGVWPLFRERAFIWCILIWLVLAGADVCWMERSGRYRT